MRSTNTFLKHRVFNVNPILCIQIIHVFHSRIYILGCSVGEYYKGGCKTCERGFYQEISGFFTACKQCGKDQTTFKTGSNSSKDCYGKYSLFLVSKDNVLFISLFPTYLFGEFFLFLDPCLQLSF